MPDTSLLPGPMAVRNLFEDLLGRDTNVIQGDPLAGDEMAKAAIGVYVDPRQHLFGVIGLDLALAAFAGAALGLVPVGAAEDSIEEGRLVPNIEENLGELFNVLTSLLNREGAPHVKLHQVLVPGEQVPADIRAHLVALGRRLDLTIDISRYGKGRFALSLAP